MANITSVNVYLINQGPPLSTALTKGFPSTFAGCVAGDCSGDLTTRSLSTGVNVYSFITDSQGNKYYCRETLSQLITLFG